MHKKRLSEQFWRISHLTALKKNRFSLLFITASFITLGLLSFVVPRNYQAFMFFLFGMPVVYTGLVYSLTRAFYVSVFAFMVHIGSSWPHFLQLLRQGLLEEIFIEGIFIVVAYLFSCLFITKILLNERENQQKLLNMADINAHVAHELANANQQISEIYTNTIQALAAAIDAKDPYTKGHSERVTNYATAVARAMGLSEKETQNIFYAAILHDIGKIGINESILKKPGPLTTSEFKEIKKHPEIGATILSSVPFLEEVVPVVLHHHEYFNGQGYPRGLQGGEIPLGARIVSVVDAFDAITTDRPYRKGYSKSRAMADIWRSAGIQFDPSVVEIFAAVIEREEVSQLSEVAAGAQS